MVRTQIQLTEEQAVALRSLSLARRVSMAELIRMSIDSLMLREKGLERSAIIERAKSAVGRFSSGTADSSAEHDRRLADAFGTK